MALDFNGNSAVTKLRSLIDEATLAKSDDKEKLVAIQERISYSQRTGNSLDVRSALFNILATPPKSRLIKLCAASSRDPAPPRSRGDLSDHTLSGVLAPNVLDPAIPVGNRDISLGIALPNANCSSNCSLYYTRF